MAHLHDLPALKDRCVALIKGPSNTLPLVPSENIAGRALVTVIAIEVNVSVTRDFTVMFATTRKIPM
jgi:hypothetical protein